MISQPLATQSSESGGRGVMFTWWYTLFSMVAILVATYALLFLELLAVAPIVGWRDWALVCSLALSLIGAVRYTWLLRRGFGAGLPALRYQLILLLPAILVTVLASLQQPRDLMMTVPAWWAACCMVALLPKNRMFGLLLAAAAIGLLRLMAGVLSGADPIGLFSFESQQLAFYFFFILFFAPITLVMGLWWWNIVVQLDRSRSAFAELSVARERLRFAADLHDIQGHHLQVIALKTELAERLMDRDPQAARQQVHEAQVLARTALEDTRALVRGYRQVAFTTELRNAAEVFEAASIQATVRADGVELSADQGTLFGVLMREASTNILRHSAASKVSIQLSAEAAMLVLSVSNDGIIRTEDVVTAEGTGLRALKERLEAAGGSLEVAQSAERFTVTARLPEAL
ncbi:sensor histidine kinase [Psychromicrobium lacuslunae]|uniref:Uncharacterized protein n=1 Tax=Psychromicrobium lacuslunae TaxID=1618207 RepID=A0A0D4C233_9MICC|nr:histidine kinase [Psychromicrobium lacuslunae]AJT42589.1 hypothetical protein UM93_15875 [Psychromicrobium lacuslunae]